MKNWDMLSLLGLSLLSLHGRALAINRLTQDWVTMWSDIAGRRNRIIDVMRDTNSVMSGSAAVALLQRDPDALWHPKGFDIFTPVAGFETMCLYLIDSLLCPVLGNDTRPGGDTRGSLHAAMGITDARKLQCGITVINVYCVDGLSPLRPLPHFYATHLVNFVSADTFCIAYPDLFFSKRSLVKTTEDVSNASLKRWTDRGWNLSQDAKTWRGLSTAISRDCAELDLCPRKLRWFLDGACCSMSFRKSGAHPTAYAPVPLQLSHAASEAACGVWTTAWVWGGSACDNAACQREILPVVQDVILCNSVVKFSCP